MNGTINVVCLIILTVVGQVAALFAALYWFVVRPKLQPVSGDGRWVLEALQRIGEPATPSAVYANLHSAYSHPPTSIMKVMHELDGPLRGIGAVFISRRGAQLRGEWRSDVLLRTEYALTDLGSRLARESHLRRAAKTIVEVQ